MKLKNPVLVEEQLNAFKFIMDFIFNSDSKATVINGNAGCGKSTLIAFLVKELNRIGCNVRVLTPTGKAASVLQKNGISFAQTIHSFMYTPILDDNGNLVYFQLNLRMSDFYDVIIVDEASMLSYEIFQDLCQLDVLLIAIGDSMQFPPINKDPSNTFNIMDAPSYTMKGNLRITSQNPLYELVNDIRQSGRILPHKYKNNENIKFCKHSDITKQYLQDTKPDIILCGTNRKRTSLNQLYRIALEKTSTIATTGDIVICTNNTIIDGLTITNGERFKVTSILGKKKFKTSQNINLEAHAYEFQSIDYTYKKIRAYVCDESWTGDFYLSNGEKRNHKEPIMDMEFGYAITVHKAQGSEYDNVLFVEENINGFDMQKFRYTAVTRAKKSITIARG